MALLLTLGPITGILSRLLVGEWWSETADSYGNDSLFPWFHIRTHPALVISLLRPPRQAYHQHPFRGDHPMHEY